MFKKNSKYSPEYLELLLDRSHDGIVACDNDFKIIYGNNRAFEIHGIPNNEDPDSWGEYVEVLDADGIPTPYDRLPMPRALQGEKVIDAYHILKRKNLPSILVKYNSEPLIDKTGKKIGAILTIEDSQDLAITLARFKAIFDQSPLSIQIFNKEGKTILVNKAYQNLWGLPDDFVNNYILKDYNILEDELLIKSGEIEFIRKAFSGEVVHVKPFLYDPTVLGLPGRPRWAGGIIYPLKDEKGEEVQEVVIIHQDITEEKQSQEERGKLYSQLEAILRQMPAGVMVSDLNSKVAIYNEQMTRIIGEPAQALQIFHHPLSSALSGKVLTSHEIQHVAPEKITYIATSSGPIEDAQGNILASVVIATDITKQKRNELNKAFQARIKSLLVSDFEYESVLNQVGNAVIPYLTDGCIIDVLEGENIKRLVTRHFDEDKEKFLRLIRDKLDLKPGDKHPSMRAIATGIPELISDVNDAFLKVRTVDQEHFDLVKKLGSRSHIAIPLEVRGKTIGAINFFLTNPDRPLFDEVDFELAKDIARFASIIIDNARLYRDAKCGVKLRDDFISIASHELRTPITSLNLQVEVLKNLVDGLKTDNEVPRLMKKFLESTNNQLSRLTRLVNDMLDISRITSGKLSLHLRPTDMKQLVSEVLERFDDQLKTLNIEIKCDCQENLILTCDPERIDQVITNFMTNAIRYGKRKPIHLTLEENADKVIFKVKDFGRGIRSEDQKRVFNRFERAHTSEDVSGLGLGLYINKKIIDEHQGNIRLESVLGEGSTFIVELPKI